MWRNSGKDVSTGTDTEGLRHDSVRQLSQLQPAATEGVEAVLRREQAFRNEVDGLSALLHGNQTYLLVFRTSGTWTSILSTLLTAVSAMASTRM